MMGSDKYAIAAVARRRHQIDRLALSRRGDVGRAQQIGLERASGDWTGLGVKTRRQIKRRGDCSTDSEPSHVALLGVSGRIVKRQTQNVKQIRGGATVRLYHAKSAGMILLAGVWVACINPGPAGGWEGRGPALRVGG